MNLASHELNRLGRVTIWWSLSLSLLAVGFLFMYPVFSKDLTTAQQVLDKIPATLKSALNISTELFANITGFFGYFISFIVLAGSVQALVLGIKSLSEEETNKTADFLLTKPVTRNQIIWSKFYASFVSLVVTNLVFSSLSLATAMTVTDDNLNIKLLVLISGSLLLVQLVFLTLGFLLSASIKKIRSVISLAMPIAFAFFIISALDSAIGSLNLASITPFKFLSPVDIIKNGGYETKYIILSAALVSIFFGMAILIYNKRDIKGL